MDSSCWVCTVDWQVGVVDGAAERLVRVPELVGERLRGPLGCLALLSLLKATGAGFDYQARSLWCSTPLVSPSLFFSSARTLQRESASSVSARVHVSVGLDNNYWAVGATKWSHWPREEPGCQAWRLEGKKWQNGEMETGWRPRSLSWGLCGAQPGEDDDAIGPA